MSYCRFSSDNFKSDLYIYQDVMGGYTTHVAYNRLVGDVPQVPKFSDPEWAAAYRTQLKWLETAKHEPIKLTHAGKSFNDETLEELLDRVRDLKKLGYHVPDYVEKGIEQEIKDAAAEHLP